MYATYICVVDGTRLLVSQLCIEQNNSESVLPILNIRGIEFKGKRRPGGGNRVEDESAREISWFKGKMWANN